MSPIPTRMNMVLIVLHLLNRTQELDPDYREPIGPKKYEEDGEGEPVYTNLRGQVVYRTKDNYNPAYTGDDELTAGHMVFRTSSLNLIGLTIRKGDLMISAAGIPGNHRVTEVRPTAHLRGKPNTMTVYFTQNTNVKAGIH